MNFWQPANWFQFNKDQRFDQKIGNKVTGHLILAVNFDWKPGFNRQSRFLKLDQHAILRYRFQVTGIHEINQVKCAPDNFFRYVFIFQSKIMRNIDTGPAFLKYSGKSCPEGIPLRLSCQIEECCDHMMHTCNWGSIRKKKL
jgi:hypothetical protein